jgi:hypothetical protein
MIEADYEKCAHRIAQALALESGEKVVLKVDRRVFTPIVEPLQNEILGAGACVSGTVFAEEISSTASEDVEKMRQLFSDADVFIWLPELHQGNSPALSTALTEWLDARRGRSVHFHWNSGAYPIGFVPLPSQEIIDRMYLEALDVNPGELERRHLRALAVLRSGRIRITTPEGTDFSFETGDRPFCSQIGDASRIRMKAAKIRIDRDVELPAGVLRVAPVETSASGTIFLPVWRPIHTEGRNIVLQFANGHMAPQGVGADQIAAELDAAGGDARMFREFALGFNPALAIRREHPFIAYYGYGSGIVRLSLGDNEDMGGANRGGGVYWNFLHNATVTVGSTTLVRDGELML